LTGVNPHHGTPVKPRDPTRIPGGSSSGSAVAVASGIAAAAIGTDAGGSVRVPAALNGLVGLKPTYGGVPGEGIARLTKDLDAAGPIGWTVDDVTALYEAMSGAAVDRAAKVERPALLADFFEGAEEGVAKAVRAAATEAFGALPEVRTPNARWAAAVEFVVVGTDAAELMAGLMKSSAALMGADARTILRLGAGLGRDDRRRADGVRGAMRKELDALFAQHAVLIGPAVGSFAPPLSEVARKTGELDTRTMARLAAVTFPANLCGLPACTVPCVREGLPTGLQIIGRPGGEAAVLAAARLVEARIGPRRPPRWHGDA
jgi:aspartyl-tRNA(Asn)/glutamyl-tRNA(Gln) amidotransferase subunit A